jgi:hypothetical protein
MIGLYRPGTHPLNSLVCASLCAGQAYGRAVLRQFDPELLESFAAPSMKKASQGSNRFPYTVRSRRSAGNAQTPRGRPSYWGRMIMPISS